MKKKMFLFMSILLMLLSCNKESMYPTSDAQVKNTHLNEHYEEVRSQLRKAFITSNLRKGSRLHSELRSLKDESIIPLVDTLTIEEILEKTNHSKAYQELMLKTLSFIDSGCPLPTPEEIDVMPFSLEEKYTLVTAQAIVREVSHAIGHKLIGREENPRHINQNPQGPTQAPAPVDCDQVKSEVRKTKIYRRVANVGVTTVGATTATAIGGAVVASIGGPLGTGGGAAVGAMVGGLVGFVESTIYNVYEYIVDDLEEVERAYQDCIKKGPSQRCVDALGAINRDTVVIDITSEENIKKDTLKVEGSTQVL